MKSNPYRGVLTVILGGVIGVIGVGMMFGGMRYAGAAIFSLAWIVGLAGTLWHFYIMYTTRKQTRVKNRVKGVGDKCFAFGADPFALLLGMSSLGLPINGISPCGWPASSVQNK